MFSAMPACKSWSCATVVLLITPSRTTDTVTGLCALVSITSFSNTGTSVNYASSPQAENLMHCTLLLSVVTQDGMQTDCLVHQRVMANPVKGVLPLRVTTQQQQHKISRQLQLKSCRQHTTIIVNYYVVSIICEKA